MIVPSCPECGSRDVRRVDHLFLLILVAIFIAVDLFIDQQLLASIALVAAVAIVLLPDLRCARCQYRWNPRRERPEPVEPDANDLVERECPNCGSIEVYDRGYPILKPQCSACGSLMP